MLEEIKEYYRQINDKKSWLKKTGKKLGLKPESLQMQINGERVSAKNKAKVLGCAKRELNVQRLEIERIMNMEVIDPETVKP